MKKQERVVLILLALVAVIVASFLIVGDVEDKYENRYFNPDTVNTLNILIDGKSWNEMIKNPLADVYHECSFILNGDTYNFVGIKPCGSTSLGPMVNHKSIRFPIKIKVNKYISDQTIYGLDKFTLKNTFLDPTSMKEYLSLELMDELGIPTPLHAYTALYINGEYFGLYLMIESVENGFMSRNYNRDFGNLYRPSYRYDAKTKTTYYEGSRLEYIDDDISSYNGLFRKVVFDKTTKMDKQRLIESIKNINEKKNISKYVDLKTVIPYLAANAALPSNDNLKNPKNYYLYEDMGEISIIPWDYDLSFGTGGYNNAASAINVRADTYDASHPLRSAIYSNTEYKAMYDDSLRNIAENFLGENFAQRVDHTDSLIREYVKTDPTSFYTFDEYQAGIENLKRYGVLRGKAILQQLNGNFTKVDASNVNLSTMGKYSER